MLIPSAIRAVYGIIRRLKESLPNSDLLCWVTTGEKKRGDKFTEEFGSGGCGRYYVGSLDDSPRVLDFVLLSI